MVNIEKDSLQRNIKVALLEALNESGLASDMVNQTKAIEIIGSRTYLNQGVEEGLIRHTPKTAKNSKLMYPVRDLNEYKDELIKRGTLKIKG